ncbi:hypothetical protein OIU74_026171 [Salix koriyanagi]|uniref:Uncharacterized protein n=1 Tax=Salix koriyanagi TaxID=2511006 RepID=A0A9Q1A3R5_9ROSI|nr:hypothetical protein OIU74_026171 [Salix koriyanagi]
MALHAWHVSQASAFRAEVGHCCRDNSHANGRAGAASTLARARQMNVRPTAWRSSPSTPASLAGVTEAKAAIHRGASAQKPQAKTRQQARHAMRSGIAGRADAGTQARQFNATPTPATALHAIPDHGPPRLARQPRPPHCERSRGALLPGTTPHANGSGWGCQHLGASLANECQAHPSERQPQRRPTACGHHGADGTKNGTDAHQGVPQLETAGQDSAAGTSRHEVRDRGEGRRRGASPAI